jgi:biopolymer transport protein ExbB/TolQ/DNA-directed RNA polymerase subunit RPC12/RpoP
MYFQFGCSKCGKNLKVSDEHAGRKVRCPYCHHATVIETPEPKTQDVTELFDPNLPRPSTKDSAPAKGKETPKKPKRSSGSESEAFGTDIKLLRSAIIGTGISLGFYLLMLPFHSMYFGELFLKRGWVPFALVFLFGWSFAILYLKSRKLAKQKESMVFDLLPNELSARITQDTLDKFLTHIHDLPTKANESFLINRVVRGLEHFRVLDNSSEVASRLETQSDIDAQSVDSSYTIIKVFIWAIPILGFIGTVIGISAAVGGFSGGMEGSEDISALKESLNSVTGGLSTAFDTTLVALVMSLLVMFPTTSMQKAEEDLLNDVDEYCNENLLRRLRGGASGKLTTDEGVRADEVRKAIDGAMKAHHAELQTWTKKLEAVGETLTQQVTSGVSEVDTKLQERYEKRVVQFNKLANSMAGKQAEVATQIDSAQQQLADLQANQTADLKDVAEAGTQLRAQASQSMQEAAESLSSYFVNLNEGLVRLNDVLVQLGEKQIVIESTPAARKKRGFRLFGR